MTNKTQVTKDSTDLLTFHDDLIKLISIAKATACCM